MEIDNADDVLPKPWSQGRISPLRNKWSKLRQGRLSLLHDGPAPLVYSDKTKSLSGHNIEFSSAAESTPHFMEFRNSTARFRRPLRRLLQRFVVQSL